MFCLLCKGLQRSLNVVIAQLLGYGLDTAFLPSWLALKTIFLGFNV